MSTILLSLVLSTVVFSPAGAATPDDVKQVVDFMFGRTASTKYVPPIFDKDLMWSDFDPARAYISKFVKGDCHYTMKHSRSGFLNSNVLSFFERCGVITYATSWSLPVYGDWDQDGVVDFGASVNPAMGFAYYKVDGSVEGAVNQAYWQKKYDDAIAAALRYYGGK